MKKNGRYPQKTTINLVIKERGQLNPGRLIPLLVVVLLLAATFGKLAVADRLAGVNGAQSTLEATLMRQKELHAALADFDEVEAEYSRYATGWMTEEETSLVDRMEAVGLIEQELMTVSTVKQFNLEGNLLSVDLTGISLGGTSGVVETLYTYPIVSQVEVYNAATGQSSGQGSLVSLLITLVQDWDGEEGGQS